MQVIHMIAARFTVNDEKLKVFLARHDPTLETDADDLSDGTPAANVEQLCSDAVFHGAIECPATLLLYVVSDDNPDGNYLVIGVHPSNNYETMVIGGWAELENFVPNVDDPVTNSPSTHARYIIDAVLARANELLDRHYAPKLPETLDAVQRAIARDDRNGLAAYAQLTALLAPASDSDQDNSAQRHDAGRESHDPPSQ